MAKKIRSVYQVSLIVIIAVITLSAVEITLRFFEHNKTYSEAVGHGYTSGYGNRSDTWFKTLRPNSSFDADNGDFKYHYATNSFGFREREFYFSDSAEIKIICIGDSYTEGVGAPYDSTYPRLMENQLRKTGVQCEVLNAGVSGSDPFYEYKLYKHKIASVNPTHLFIAINSSDIADYIFQGGLSRFLPDGRMEAKKAPWFEYWYQHLYLARFLINDMLGYSGSNLFVTKPQYENEIAPLAVQEIFSVVDSLDSLTALHDCKLMVVIQPNIFEVVFANGDNAVNNDFLLRLEKELKKSKISVINLWEPLSNKFNDHNFTRYTYKHDSHYSAAGYEILAQAILSEVNEKYPEFFVPITGQ